MANISTGESSSIHVHEGVVKKFIADPGFPYLISFPRTGSHWLRMIMELYFGKPSLVRIFYFKDARDFTCYHRHDEDLSIRRTNVIYLYRSPPDTIHSQMNYYQEDTRDRERIAYWAGSYGSHLAKWLLEETFTTRKTVITYEGMKNSMEEEFKKVCLHFSMPWDPVKLEDAVKQVTRTEVKQKTLHDPQVVNLSDAYQREREEFKQNQTAFIMDCIYSVNPGLEKFLKR